MFDFFSYLGLGLSVAVTPTNLLFCLIGVLLGTLVGVLPGLGSVATIAMLLPFTFGLPPESSLIMLAGIYYGSQYGGSTTSILLNIPGESTAVVTAIDGHQMAKQGRAGPALAIAAIGSFIAGTFATVLVAAVAIPLSLFALRFGSVEYFSLMVLGMILAVSLSNGSVIKALGMIVLGVLLSMIGTDIETGAQRMTFGLIELKDGVELVIIAMAVFGFAEVIRNLEAGPMSREFITTKLTGLMPTRQDLKDSSGAIARGTVLGSVLGILPGGGGILSSFASYAVEKRISRHPERFGKGEIRGVAGPESANNAGSQTSFIPLLTLGLPGNAIMALLMGAMIIQGISPGPGVVREQPELFWGLIVSMWVGNLMLVILNLPLVGVWVRILRTPYRLMFPGIMVFATIGVYSISNSSSGLVIAAVFAVVGYLMSKYEFEPAPLVLAFVLGPMLEENFRRAMLLSKGDPMVFLRHPISAVLLTLALILVVTAVLPSIRGKREKVFTEAS